MSDGLIAYIGTVFDGFTRHYDAALVVDGDKISEIVKPEDLPDGCQTIDLENGLIAPGLVDLQVNGGGGRMLNSTPDVETIRVICEAHCKFGTTSLLPTMITDTPENTMAAIAALKNALAENIPGAVGLHLEGPHLSVARMGAHDPALIRVMTNDDCTLLQQIAGDLPSLLLTVAPETTTGDQIKSLSQAGAIVSLGHTDASYSAANDAAKSGARCVTHLFNAMSQLGNREPAMVGAALENPTLYAGLIADGFHVDRAAINIALRAKNGPGKLFLISDAMATVGSDIKDFYLNGRRIIRSQGRLVLSDGRLAGAD
ncbi:MAG: N-acetylglucosamine-6-phosphate deacetylase, partial [Paracoccaceae bacterium]